MLERRSFAVGLVLSWKKGTPGEVASRPREVNDRYRDGDCLWERVRHKVGLARAADIERGLYIFVFPRGTFHSLANDLNDMAMCPKCIGSA